MGRHKQIKETQMNTQNTNLGYTQKKHSGWLLTHSIVQVAKALGASFKLVTLTPNTWPNRAVRTGPGSCAHGKTSNVQNKCQGPLQLLPLLFSWPAPQNRCGQTERGGGVVAWMLTRDMFGDSCHSCCLTGLFSRDQQGLLKSQGDYAFTLFVCLLAGLRRI